MDNLTPGQRSQQMALIRSKDSKVELQVRRLVHAMGYRYRLHQKELPGCPDLVFSSRRKVIFVHGCFWHRHEGCKLARLPKSRVDFWQTKLELNRQRDLRNQGALSKLGWGVLVVWECEVRDPGHLTARLASFLDDGGMTNAST